MGVPRVIHFQGILKETLQLLGYPHGHGNPHIDPFIDDLPSTDGD